VARLVLTFALLAKAGREVPALAIPPLLAGGLFRQSSGQHFGRRRPALSHTPQRRRKVLAPLCEFTLKIIGEPRDAVE